jgi:hypothetical protein
MIESKEEEEEDEGIELRKEKETKRELVRLLNRSGAGFRICSAKKTVAVLKFDRTWFTVGSSIQCTLDFSVAQIPCLQLSWYLVQVEIPSSSSSSSPSSSPSSSSSSIPSSSSPSLSKVEQQKGKTSSSSSSSSSSIITTTTIGGGEKRTIYTDQHRRTEKLLFCPLSLSIPDHCPNEFQCEKGQLSYLLLFEFVLEESRSVRKFCWEYPVHIVSPFFNLSHQ